MKRLIFTLLCLLALAFTASAQVENRALTFEQQGRVSVGALSDLNNAGAWTVQMWINPTKWTSGAVLMERGSQFAIKMGASGSLDVTVGEETLNFAGTGIASNTWNHITLIGNGQTLKLYVNNEGEQNKQMLAGQMPETEDPVLLGGGYTGRMDEVRIWKCELPEDYERHYRNTLNSLHPNWEHLVAYYKFDQENLETNVYDYTGNKHNGTLSSSGVSRAVVEDNASFRYMKNIAYTNFERFCDRGIKTEKYLQSNMLVILGPQLSGPGQVDYVFNKNNATVTGGSYSPTVTDTYPKSRTNCLKLDGTTGCGLDCGAGTLVPITYGSGKGYAFASWVLVSQWKAGAYLIQKETDDNTGFSVRLGETESQIIVRINGAEYVKNNAFGESEDYLGTWHHIGTSVNTDNSTLTVVIDGTEVTSWDTTPTVSSWAMSATSANCYIGKGFKGHLDDVVTLTKAQTASQLTGYINEVKTPVLKGKIELWPYHQMDAYYTFDDKENLGYDSWNYKDMILEMKKAYDGYKGQKILVSLGATYSNVSSWKTYIDTDEERQAIATQMKNLMDEVGADGVDFDLEWLNNNDAGWTNYGKLCQTVRNAIGSDKLLTVSPHSYYYTFPTEYMQYVDYFFFQNYGPQAALYTIDHYNNVYDTYVNYGYPKEKMVMSFATTSSTGVIEEGGTSQVYGYQAFADKVDASDNSIPGLSGSVSFTGVDQTYDRTKKMRDEGTAGIFYWDLCNDVDLPSNEKSLIRSSAMMIASNLDKDQEVNEAADQPEEFNEPLVTLPEEGQFYRFKNVGNGNYISYNGESIAPETVGSKSVNSVFYYTDSKLQVVNGNSLYLSNTQSGGWANGTIGVNAAGNDVSFCASQKGTAGALNIQIGPYTTVGQNMNMYIYWDNGTSSYLTGNENNVSKWAVYDWILEDVTDLDIYTVTIPDGQTLTYDGVNYTNGNFIAVATGTSTEVIMSALSSTREGYTAKYDVDTDAKTINVTYKENLKTGVYYRIVNVTNEGQYITANADGANIVSNTLTATDNARVRSIWTLVDAGDGKFYLKNAFMGTAAAAVPTTGGNYSDGRDMALQQVTDLANAGVYEITDHDTYYTINCTNSGLTDGRTYLHGASGNRVVRWGDTNPSHWTIEQVDADGTDIYALNNWPKAGNFYKFKSPAWGQNVASGNDGLISDQSATASEASKLFYYDGQNLLSYTKGQYLDGVSYTAVGSEGTDVNFIVASDPYNSESVWQIRSGNDASCYWRSSWNAQPSLGALVNGNYRFQTQWIIQDVCSLPVTFYAPALGFATFCSPVAVKTPADVVAYLCKMNGNTLTMYKISVDELKDGDMTIIPANTPVLLYNSAVQSENMTVNMDITSCNETITGNDFYGTTAAATIDANYNWYSLQANKTDNTKVGFYNKTSGNLGGFKAWLRNEATTGVRSFTINFDGEGDATGIIEALGLQNEHDNVYDLSGRKRSALLKGINIVNGKKVIK